MIPARPPIRFYFDYISSNAYLAWIELPKLAAKFGNAVEPVPTLFAGLLDAHGQLGPAEVRAKAVWMWRNCQRKAALLGVPLNFAKYHPFNPLLSLRASSLPMRDDERARLVSGLMRAVWVDEQHVSEREVVARVADEAGLDGARIVEEAQTPEAKARLRAQTDDAIERWVFGVPTMMVGDELFWGFDDFPYLERHLAGEDPIDTERFPTRPPPRKASARRRQFRRGDEESQEDG